jgi:hypothetical protein
VLAVLAVSPRVMSMTPVLLLLPLVVPATGRDL